MQIHLIERGQEKHLTQNPSDPTIEEWKQDNAQIYNHILKATKPAIINTGVVGLSCT